MDASLGRLHKSMHTYFGHHSPQHARKRNNRDFDILFYLELLVFYFICKWLLYKQVHVFTSFNAIPTLFFSKKKKKKHVIFENQEVHMVKLLKWNRILSMF